MTTRDSNRDLKYFQGAKKRKEVYMARHPGKLTDKHWKALELIETGQHSLKRIAEMLGWHPQTLYDLYEGNMKKKGNVAALFHSELKKIEKKNVKKIQMLVRENKSLALELINEILREIKMKKNASFEERKLVATMMNCLSKSSPSIEINNSLSYTNLRGMSSDELVYEFKRLKALAEGAMSRKNLEVGKS